jgi:gliding motility-associated-like protein
VAVGVTPELDLVEDRIECGTYVLPTIEGNDLSGNEAYFSNPNGGGTRYEIGDIITETITLYVYDEDPNSSICNDETSFTVTILDAPNAGIDYGELFCTGDVTGSITLSDNLGTHDNNGVWTETSSPSSGAFIAASSELDLPSMTEGVYTFIYVVPAVGDCEADTSYHTITILETPEINWSLSATEGCVPETISFSAGTSDNPNFDYNWSFGNGESSTLADPEVDYTFTGCFDVSLTVTNNGQCAVNEAQADLVCIYPNPTANFTMDQDSLDATSPILTGDNLSTDADSYLWVFGDGTTSSEVDLYHDFSNAEGGYIDVTLIAYTDQGCSDTLTQQIFMFNQFTLEIPNVFTPNNDGANDLFTVYVAGTRVLEWSIYNRWGNVLSVGKEELTSGGQTVTLWEGLIDGAEATEGVYFFRLSYENYFDESGTEHGHVTVVR